MALGVKPSSFRCHGFRFDASDFESGSPANRIPRNVERVSNSGFKPNKTPDHATVEPKRDKFLICFWNPSIKKYKRIAFPFEFPWEVSGIHDFEDDFLMGFGWSIRSNEYKMVVICRDKYLTPRVYVYSLTTNSWTEINAELDDWETMQRKDNGAYFNGSCHWIRSFEKQGKGNYTMLIYNLDDQNFRYIDLPPKTQLSGPLDCFHSYKTFILKDMLSVWEIVILGHDFTVNLWVMKEYENRSSWSFYKSVVLKDYNCMFNNCFLFGVDASERLLFMVSHNPLLRACDSESREIEEFKSSETRRIWDMAPYQESLALL